MAVKEVTANEDGFAGEDTGGNARHTTDEITAVPLKGAGGNAAQDIGRKVSQTAATATASTGSGGPASVTVKEAATLLQLSESYVRELRHTKKLRSPGRNKKLILMSSITRYQNKHQKASETSSPTAADQASKNGTRNHASAGEHLLPSPAYAANNR